MKIGFITFILIGVVESFSDLFIYGQLIVPMQLHVHAVPIQWWFLYFAPSLIVCLLIGFKINSYRQALLPSIAGDIAAHIYNLTAALNHFPGHYKSWTIEGPLIWWSLGLSVQIAFYFVSIATGIFLHKIYAKKHIAT